MPRTAKKPEYISLAQAALLVPYSAQYLGLRARQGKIKAVKIGRDWCTRAEWVQEYKTAVRRYKKRERYDANAPVPPVPNLLPLRPRVSLEYRMEAASLSRTMAATLIAYTAVVSVFIFSPRHEEYVRSLDRLVQIPVTYATERAIPLARVFAATSADAADRARLLLASSGSALLDRAEQLRHVFQNP
ncbi:MAG: hypothetical protein HYW98_00095 [Candidatus Wildermuthbacteria bacterium]|nr:hypothetical protein [Candidatus Wildermuthbacteria bacterium]